MIVEKLTALKNLILKKEDRVETVLEEKGALDDCIAEKVPKIFDEKPELDPNNEKDRDQAVAIAAKECREE